MSDGRGGISDGVVLGAIGCAVGVGLLLWLWGGIAGALFGHGWPPVSGAQLPGVLVRLPARLSDPAGAWPRGGQIRIAGSGRLLRRARLAGRGRRRSAVAGRPSGAPGVAAQPRRRRALGRYRQSCGRSAAGLAPARERAWSSGGAVAA